MPVKKNHCSQKDRKGINLAMILILLGSSAMIVDCSENTKENSMSQPAKQGEVRAGKIISPGALLNGSHADGCIGDYKIYNTKAAFIVQAPGGKKGWLGAGGALLDATYVDNKMEGPDRLQELVPALSFVRYQDAKSIEIVRDLEGGAKAILVKGTGRGIPILDAALPAPSEPLPLKWTTMYILEPDKPRLKIVTTLNNTGRKRLALKVGHIITPDESARIFVPGAGFDKTALSSASKRSFYTLADDTAYGFFPGEGKQFRALFTLAELLPVFQEGDKLSIAAGGEGSFEMNMVVSKEDAAGLDHEIGIIESYDKEPHFEVHAKLSDSMDLDGVFVDVFREVQGEKKQVTRAKPDENGSVSFWLEKGDYFLDATGPGRDTPDLVTMHVQGPIDHGPVVPINPKSFLDYKVVDQSGNPVPCRITMLQGKDAPDDARSAGYIVSPSGQGREAFAPGEYTAFVTRGYEFEPAVSNITIEPGKSAELNLELKQAFKTPGFISADLHTHCIVSIDSGLELKKKVAGLAADGLDFVVLTDHDAVFDLSQTVRELGLEHLLCVQQGMEISPLYGHSNVLGLETGPNTPQYFPVQWAKYDDSGRFEKDIYPPETWNQARTELGAVLVQVNHPRSFEAYFDFVGLNPKTGDVEKPEAFSNDFDLLEIFDGLDKAAQVEEKTLPDFFGLLNLGWNKTATGDSDQHEEDQMSGNVRNYVQVLHDRAGEIKPSEVFASLKAHRSLLTSGPYIEFSINGLGIGSTVVPKGGIVKASIKVMAATFVPVDYVHVIGNGEVVADLAVTQKTGAVRFDEILDLDPKRDTWYLVIAGSKDNSPRPLHKKGSLAVTNPIWIDLAGDGFSPPAGR
ncbi:MAG: CehA/McbA family metallohydrolase [Deltaproteobacteria bacterium]|nr:CehA/McbA family metallohydrolase [Deltaproteobacteria bacterium]